MTVRTENDRSKPRITWIDIGKAIALFIIITGHTLGGFALVCVFSFTVSLFFISSGLTGRFSTSKKFIIRDSISMFKRLVFPSALTLFILNIYNVIYQLFNSPKSIDLSSLNPLDYFLTVIYSRVDDVVVSGYTIKAIGIIWFFAALFSAWAITNIILTLLPRKIAPLGIIVASLLGFFLSKARIVLPLDIDIALTVVPYLYLGSLVKPYIIDTNKTYSNDNCKPFTNFSFRLKLQPKLQVVILFILSAVIYLITYYIINSRFQTYFDIAKAQFPLYPLCFVMAIAGTIATFIISYVLSHVPIINTILSTIGRNTLYLYCIHGIDLAWKSLWKISDIMFINYLLRLIIDLAIMCIIIYIRKKFLKKHI